MKINGFVLRVIAMTTMVCDHLGVDFFDNNVVMRSIGRLAFPLYAFLLVDGFLHIKKSSERVKKHLQFLVMLALVSEFCYDLMEMGLKFENYKNSQSAMITLLLGFLGLMAIDQWKENKVPLVAVILLTGLLNYVTMANFKLVGVWLIYAFYLYLLKAKDMSYVKRLGFLYAILIPYVVIYNWARFDFCGWEMYIEKFIHFLPWYGTHMCLPLILAFYNGELGYSKLWFRKTYSYFYPAHMFVIGVVHIILNAV